MEIFVAEDGVAMQDVEDSMVEVGVLVEEVVDLVVLFPWLATGVECIATWPVTVPPLVARQ